MTSLQDQALPRKNGGSPPPMGAKKTRDACLCNKLGTCVFQEKQIMPDSRLGDAGTEKQKPTKT
jgi:hypothetical protein